jgi:transposase
MVAEEFDFVVGVDTHRDNHSVAVLNRAGAILTRLQVGACAAGYQQLLELVEAKAPGSRLWAIEGTRSYGLGVTRYLQARGEQVGEVDVPKRQARTRGKSDSIDAERAARQALAQPRVAQPRADGEREALRMLVLEREQLVQWRTEACQQIGNLLLGLPEQQRAGLRFSGSHAWERLLKACARLQADPQAEFENRIRLGTISRLAERAQEFEKAAAALYREIGRLVAKMSPKLSAESGVGPATGAQVLLVWSHAGRFDKESGFARIAGAAPLPASSGQIVRHRLSRLGDRKLNAALSTIVLTRRRYHQPTKQYVQRRRQTNKTDREINRCLKRYLARRLFRLLEASAGARTGVPS